MDTYITLTETDNNGEEFRYKIILKEYLKAFKMLDGTWKISDPNCLFEKRKKLSDGSVTDLNRAQTLFKGYHEIKYALQITFSPSRSFFELLKTSDGTSLRSLL